MNSNDESNELVKSWIVESKFFNKEFEKYDSALSTFDRISKEGTQVILYEIKKNPSDGSTIKKTPLLNSKKSKAKSKSFIRIIHHKSNNKSDSNPTYKSIFKGYKVRILVLIIVFLTFLGMVFFMNSIAGELSVDITLYQNMLFVINNQAG